MSNFKSVEEAKAFLTENGYYTGNLWCVADVQAKFECTDEEAQEVLDGALNNEATMQQIWFSIETFGEMEGYKEVEDVEENLLN